MIHGDQIKIDVVTIILTISIIIIVGFISPYIGHPITSSMPSLEVNSSWDIATRNCDNICLNPKYCNGIPWYIFCIKFGGKT